MSASESATLRSISSKERTISALRASSRARIGFHATAYRIATVIAKAITMVTTWASSSGAAEAPSISRAPDVDRELIYGTILGGGFGPQGARVDTTTAHGNQPRGRMKPPGGEALAASRGRRDFRDLRAGLEHCTGQEDGDERVDRQSFDERRTDDHRDLNPGNRLGLTPHRFHRRTDRAAEAERGAQGRKSKAQGISQTDRCCCIHGEKPPVKWVNLVETTSPRKLTPPGQGTLLKLLLSGARAPRRGDRGHAATPAGCKSSTAGQRSAPGLPTGEEPESRTGATAEGQRTCPPPARSNPAARYP